MKRKLVLLSAATMLSLSLFGCSTEVTNDDIPEDTVCQAPSDDYCGGCGTSIEDLETLETKDKIAQTTVEYNGVSFSLFADANAILDELGEPTETSEFDSFYNNTYENCVIEYESTNDDPTIDYLLIKTDEFTSNGIKIGASEEEVKKAFGEPSSEYDCEDQHFFDYYYDEFSQYFTFKDGKLVEFSFTANCTTE